MEADRKNDLCVLSSSIILPKLLDLSQTPHEPIKITHDDNFTDYSFPGLGTFSQPYRIENYNITTTTQKGISIEGTTDYFVIRNCYVETNGYGIYIYDTYPGTASVINNICSNNRDYIGIYLQLSPGTLVTNNTCNNNNMWNGISMYSCSDVTVTNNICNNNDNGISIWVCENLVLENNTCNNNNQYGISIGYSDDSTIVNNICKGNRYGLDITDSDDSILTHNLIQENVKHGFSFDSDSDNNIIYMNFFITNNLGGTSQAYDAGIDNTWYDASTKKGNYWNNWDSRKPYPIDGEANSTDPYPLDENLERIYYEFMYIPSIILMAIIFSIIRKRRRKLMIK